MKPSPVTRPRSISPSFRSNSADGNVEKRFLFSMILGYSRKIYAELIQHCDLPTFLDCHIRAFDHFGGVPNEILYDRMKNVYIGRLAGRPKFNDTLVGFALHYGFIPRVAPSYAAWVKGKVETALHLHPGRASGAVTDIFVSIQPTVIWAAG